VPDTNWPANFDDGTSLPEPTAANNQDQTGFLHADQHYVANRAIKAIQAKQGKGASTPTANTAFRGTGTGTSDWGKLSPAYLTGAGAGDANTVLATVGGTTVALQKIVAAMMAGAGAGDANSVLATVGGTTVAMQKIVDGMVTSVGPSKIVNGTNGQALFAGASTPGFRNIIAGDYYTHAMMARKITTQSAARAVLVPITYTDASYVTEIFPSGSSAGHSTSVNPTRWNLRQIGLWLLVGTICVDIAGATYVGQSGFAPGSGATTIVSFPVNYKHASSDVQAFGIALAITTNTTDYVTHNVYHDGPDPSNMGDYDGVTTFGAVYLGR